MAVSAVPVAGCRGLLSREAPLQGPARWHPAAGGQWPGVPYRPARLGSRDRLLMDRSPRPGDTLPVTCGRSNQLPARRRSIHWHSLVPRLVPCLLPRLYRRCTVRVIASFIVHCPSPAAPPAASAQRHASPVSPTGRPPPGDLSEMSVWPEGAERPAAEWSGRPAALSRDRTGPIGWPGDPCPPRASGDGQCIQDDCMYKRNI